MKKLVIVLVLSLFSGLAVAGGGDVKLDSANIDLGDRASLQRGARIFMNYCMSCHSASFMRYNRMARDLGLTEEQVKDNLMFASDKVGELMTASITPAVAKAAFNTVPPDLSLTGRSRGADWIYSYMRSFYRDTGAVSGWNNSVFDKVAMPHVLYELQGEQRAVKNEAGHITGFELAKAGSMTEKEYDSAMRDLTNFMVYLAEPAKLVRYRIGAYVMIFMFVFFFVAYMLKKEYWRDIH
ncbi:MAG: cytochrome c1 [Gammaproteobacteria bacterium]|nr:cytochrome c1 [Gammaproteobacteria bacterium]